MRALARIVFVLVLLLTFAALGAPRVAAGGQDAPGVPKKLPDPSDPAAVGFEYDPRDLHPAARDSEPVWKRLLGPVGVGGFHVPPGRVTGPNTGPPRRIWGEGFGASLWRDPITGWPLQ